MVADLRFVPAEAAAAAGWVHALGTLEHPFLDHAPTLVRRLKARACAAAGRAPLSGR
ncbi:MAG: hypothetical protein ACLFU0_11215 [Alphaproteobacteria bacterium]